MDDQETKEEMTKRLAQNRYDFRTHFRWKLNENDKDDWRAAEEQVRKIEMQDADV